MSMTDMELFFTRQVANEGVELPLFLPGTTTPSGHWIRVRGIDSDEFRLAQDKSRREVAEIVQLPEPERSERRLAQQRNLIASLVMDWSFSKPCTFENVVEFLKEAPQIEDAINQVAARRSLFFKNGSSNTSDSLDPSSN